VIGYVLVPFYAPEIVMSDTNIERARTPYEIWCRSPTWEVLLALLIQTVMQFQPILLAIFIWTIGQMLRDEPLEARGRSVTNMGLSIVFIMMAYQLYACAGTSNVLVTVERVFYTLWFFFQAAFIVRLATACQACRELLDFYLHPDT
ncbi:MAG: hypothetical protein NZO58_14725, partial [Gemmataceae bacterium]|nr:hypothetical protein [Gemmataceae bacterium]